MAKLILAISLLLLASTITASQLGNTYVIRDARIVTVSGPVIARGTVVIRDGKIADVGESVAVPAGATVIAANGLTVYPGLFDAGTILGLTEIGAVKATNDFQEIGDFNPQLVAATAVHAESELLPVTRVAGITHALTMPQGNGIAGQASVIALDGWTPEQMTIKRSAGMALNWPSITTKGDFDFQTFTFKPKAFKVVKKEWEEKIEKIARHFEDARAYKKAREASAADARLPRTEVDLKLEAMMPVIEGKLPMLVFTDHERDIKEAVKFAEDQKIKIILMGSSRAWKVADLLKQKNVPVVMPLTMALPSHEDDPYDAAHTAAAKLEAAGVKWCFSTGSASSSRRLPYQAATAIAYGLAPEAALRAMTLSPAEIFGVADRLGSIEKGKVANLIVTDGDPFEIKTRVLHLFINGQPVDLDNKHERLYRRYNARP